ncbi:MAG: YlbF family regulator [Planctomycetes bacterium]|nr:YlbF family regulator [Planctomycetota bacterium]
MATTQEILAAAKELGKLIATHEASAKFEETLRKLEADVEAQRALNDYNRHMTKLSEKEAAGKPIEVEDKKQLEKLQAGIARNATLRDFQMRQMDYLDLMRRVDEAMSGDAGAAAPGAAPAGSPDIAGAIRPGR